MATRSSPRSTARAATKKKSSKPGKAAPVGETLKLLARYYPDAHCELNFSTPEELLVATILSAQCTDKRVNLVTDVLFKELPVPQGLASASLPEIEGIIRPTGFFKNKAKSLKKTSEILVQKYSGKVPQSMEEIRELPGVGRKTANVVLGNAYHMTTGVVVDTHVTRLSFRLGWSSAKTAEKIEVDLQELIPKDQWIIISHYLIFHGRRVCKARKPDCSNCFLNELCPKRGVVVK